MANLLSVLFIPIFLVLLVLISLKFQLLNYNFWERAFERGSVYQKLENSLPKIINFKTNNEDEMSILVALVLGYLQKYKSLK